MKASFQYFRKRKMIRRLEGAPEFDSSSVGDLAFLLLIFFIVTSSFILRQGIFFSLPSKSAGSVKVKKKFLVDVYPKNDGYVVDGASIERDNLITDLQDRVKDSKNVIMIVHMAKDVRYERLVDALSVAEESGVKKVSLKNTE